MNKYCELIKAAVKIFSLKNVIRFFLDYYKLCLKKQDERLLYDHLDDFYITFCNITAKWNGLIPSSNNFGSFSTKSVKIQTS